MFQFCISNNFESSFEPQRALLSLTQVNQVWSQTFFLCFMLRTMTKVVMFYYMIVWTRHFLINKLLITFYTKRKSKLFFLDFLITIIIHTINFLVSVSCWLENLFMPMQWTQFNDSSCNNYSSFLLCRIKIMHFLLCKTAHYLLFYIFLLYKRIQPLI